MIINEWLADVLISLGWTPPHIVARVNITGKDEDGNYELEIPPEQKGLFSESAVPGFVGWWRYGARKPGRGELGAVENFRVFVRPGAPPFKCAEGKSILSTLRKYTTENRAKSACDHCHTMNINVLLGGVNYLQRCEKCSAMRRADRVWVADTTGLCTGREWAETLFDTRGDISRWNPMGIADHPLGNRGAGEMSFTHKGKRYVVEMVVTRCEDAT